MTDKELALELSILTSTCSTLFFRCTKPLDMIDVPRGDLDKWR